MQGIYLLTHIQGCRESGLWETNCFKETIRTWHIPSPIMQPPPLSTPKASIYECIPTLYSICPIIWGPNIPNYNVPHMAPPIHPNQPTQGGYPIYYHVQQPTANMRHFPGQVGQGYYNNTTWGCRRPGHSNVTPREHGRAQQRINRPFYQPYTEAMGANVTKTGKRDT